MVEITAATQADAELMAATLNPFHSRCIVMLGKETPAEAIARAFGGSTRMWAGRIDGELVALWGVYPLEGGCGYPWLFATPRIAKVPLAAYVVAHHAVKEMLAVHPRLYGALDGRFEASVRFARHLGFHVEPSDKPDLYTIEIRQSWLT